MVEAITGMLLTVVGVVVLAKQVALRNHSGRRYFDSLTRGKMLCWKSEELMRVRRSLQYGKIFIGFLAFILLSVLLGAISAHVIPSTAYVVLTITICILWASLQFPGEFKKEFFSGKPLLMVCILLPWPLLLLDWMVDLHPGMLFGFVKDLQLFGVSDPNRFQLAFYLSCLLTCIVFCLRIIILLAMSLPALVLANCYRVQQRVLHCSHWCWRRSSVAVVAILAGVYLSWIG
ncbi:MULTISPECIES: hypothetical protein [Corallincola]|uniref:Uncharacterized protein n=3 Tax=Corallincola TaxID=1775176 RepID=A0A368NSY4_9GAMM|nr:MULTISPECIES: hypothetical protein [Corallincola]RCU52589.1 hypothetical protein DU002_01055 [Corallincola holothuriorum]TAA48218.1 hypothetical protein EXY25_03010 [Corallincola spongiicola]TCI02487.1 hypothetical protein EZV61_14125 [Corallincola luteus]